MEYEPDVPSWARP